MIPLTACCHHKLYSILESHLLLPRPPCQRPRQRTTTCRLVFFMGPRGRSRVFPQQVPRSLPARIHASLCSGTHFCHDSSLFVQYLNSLLIIRVSHPWVLINVSGVALPGPQKSPREASGLASMCFDAKSAHVGTSDTVLDELHVPLSSPKAFPVVASRSRNCMYAVEIKLRAMFFRCLGRSKLQPTKRTYTM